MQDFKHLKRELVFTLVSFYLMNFIRKNFSITAYWIRGLRRYLPPTVSELETFSNARSAKRDKRGKRTTTSSEVNPQSGIVADFTIPSDSAISLQSIELDDTYVTTSKYAIEFDLLVNVLCGTSVVYMVSEVASHVTDYSLGNGASCAFLWAASSVLLSIYAMLAIVVDYTGTDASSPSTAGGGGLLVLFIVGFAAFLVVSVLLIVPTDDVFDFHIVQAHEDFSERVSKLCAVLQIPPLFVSLDVLKGLLAAGAGCMTALLLHPTLRHVRCSISLKHAMAAFGGASASRGSLGNALVTVNDVLPPLVLLLFVPSISRDLVVGSAVLTTQQFDALRAVAVVLTAVARLATLRAALQAHLDQAERRLHDIRVHPKVFRIPASRLQHEVLSVSRYGMCAAVHLAAPAVLLVSMTVLWRIKTAGTDVPAVDVVPDTSEDESFPSIPELFSRNLYCAALAFFTWWWLVATSLLSLGGSVYFQLLV